MDRTKLWYYPLLCLFSKMICSMICLVRGHVYTDSWYCDRCGRHCLK